MTQSVELLLDGASQALVVRQWRRLQDAGLASQAGHPGNSNRPHVTLAAVPEIDDAGERALTTALAGLPAEARLGPLAVFGRDPLVLVRLVVPAAGLLDLHAAVAAAVRTPTRDRSAVGRWVPHVTLAHRMPRDQLVRALEVLDPDDVPVRFERARRWDSVERRTWLVG